MSLLATLAKGLGAGTIDNAKVGFAEQQRQREAAQRKEEQAADWAARDGQLEKQLVASREDTDKRLAANQADTELRLKAQIDENAKQRAHDWALFEHKLAAETKAAASNASVQAREAHAKNLMGTFDKLAEHKSELMANDKITDEQRSVALGEIDSLIYTLAADKGAQQLLGEFGGAGYTQYGLSLAPQQAEQKPREGGGNGQGNPESSGEPAVAPQRVAESEVQGYAKTGYGQHSVIGNLQKRNGGSTATGYDPQYRDPANVIPHGQPVKLVSKFSLPTSDTYVPPYARYP